MNFVRTDIPDVFIVEPKVYIDDRGYFLETYRKEYLEDFLGRQIYFCQENESKSAFGVLRGLHFQIGKYAQTKLVRVIKGRVLDVVVDIRTESKTYGEHVSVELSGENKRQIFIPQGFAHGFITLEDETILSYKVDNYYSPENESGILFDDETLNIDWQLPLADIKVANKDRQLKKFNLLKVQK